jgi:Leucine Rich Repeat.
MKRYLSKIKSTHVQICLLTLLLLGIIIAMPMAIAEPNSNDVAAINSIIKNNNLNYIEDDFNNWDFIDWDLTGGEHRVVYLDLNGKSLTGSLDVSRLRYLEALDCSNNRLTSLALPVTLEVLDCSNNRLTSLGTLPLH